MASITSRSVKGVLWSAIERFSLQGVQFVIGVVLARLLSPSSFGMIGMLSIFLSLSQTFIDCGFSNALIRQKETRERDYGTVFLLNLLISLIAFFVLCIIAPFVSDFYQLPELKSVMRTVSLTLVINALYAVHKVKLTKNIDFKTQSKASFLSAIISGVLGIILAYNSFGVWSLVYQTICNSLLNLFFMVALLRWFPKVCFSKSSFHELFGFGSKLLVASLISSIYSNLYNIVIGKKFAASSLGYFSRADQLGNFPSQNVAGILSRVTYPILAQLQDNPQKLKSIYEKYLRVTCFAVFPLMMGLSALSTPLISIMFGDKWIPSAILLQIICIGLMFDPVCNINLNLLYVKGRSDLVLKLEIIKKTIAITILLSSIPFGLVWICVGKSLYGIVATVLNTRYTGQFIGLNTWNQIKLILPYCILSVVMYAGVFAFANYFGNTWVQLLGGILVGCVLYVGFSWIFKVQAMQELIQLLKKKKTYKE